MRDPRSASRLTRLQPRRRVVIPLGCAPEGVQVHDGFTTKFGTNLGTNFATSSTPTWARQARDRRGSIHTDIHRLAELSTGRGGLSTGAQAAQHDQDRRGEGAPGDDGHGADGDWQGWEIAQVARLGRSGPVAGARVDVVAGQASRVGAAWPSNPRGRRSTWPGPPTRNPPPRATAPPQRTPRRPPRQGRGPRAGRAAGARLRGSSVAVADRRRSARGRRWGGRHATERRQPHAGTEAWHWLRLPPHAPARPG
jgi:hypothetical protein